MKAPLLLLVLLAASASASAAQVYAWTDANGTRHFSDSPPPASANAQKIKVRGSLTSTEDAQAPQVVADATPKAPDAPVTASNPNKPLVDSPENRAKQCQLARSNLALLQTNYQVTAPQGDDGKAQVLDEGGRKQAIERATDQVAFYCK
jgi:D-alanyl-D-alanine carboxypeptidase